MATYPLNLEQNLVRKCTPLWMRRNDAWVELWESIGKILDDVFTNNANERGIPNLDLLWNIEEVPAEYLDDIANTFQWNLDFKFSEDVDDLRFELAGLMEWFRTRYIRNTYISILTTLEFSGDVYNLWTKDFTDFFRSESTSAGILTDEGYFMDEGYAMDTLIPTPHLEIELNCVKNWGTELLVANNVDKLRAYIENIRYVNSTIYYLSVLEMTLPSGNTSYTDYRDVYIAITSYFTAYYNLYMDNFLEMDTPGLTTDNDVAVLLAIMGDLRVGFGAIIDADYITVTNYNKTYDETTKELTIEGEATPSALKIINYYILLDIYGNELMRVTCPDIYSHTNFRNKFIFKIENIV